MSRDVLGEFFVETSDALERMADESTRLGRCFRRNAIQEGNQGLAAYSGELRQFPALIGVLTGPLGLDPARFEHDGRSVRDQVDQFGGWVESLIAAHEQADWLTVADILELDIEPVLRAWAPRVRQCPPGDCRPGPQPADPAAERAHP